MFRFHSVYRLSIFHSMCYFIGQCAPLDKLHSYTSLLMSISEQSAFYGQTCIRLHNLLNILLLSKVSSSSTCVGHI